MVHFGGVGYKQDSCCFFFFYAIAKNTETSYKTTLLLVLLMAVKFPSEKIHLNSKKMCKEQFCAASLSKMKA